LELRFVQIRAGGRPCQVFGCSGLTTKAHQPARPVSTRGVVRRPRDTRVDAQKIAETLQQPEIDATQTHVRRTCEQRLERTLVITKIRCPRVTGTDAAPVLLVPPPIADEHVADALLESTAHHNRNRQPDRSTGTLDLVPVAPVPLRVLH